MANEAATLLKEVDLKRWLQNTSRPAAVQLVFPGELRKHATQQENKAIERFIANK